MCCTSEMEEKVGIRISDWLGIQWYDVASVILHEAIAINIYGWCGAHAVTCLGGLVCGWCHV